MAIGRYTYSTTVAGKDVLSTPNSQSKIFKAATKGRLAFTTQIVQTDERLDHIAAKAYGSSKYWWIIAAASGIGWGLQVPPGTIVRIPTNLGEIIALIR